MHERGRARARRGDRERVCAKGQSAREWTTWRVERELSAGPCSRGRESLAGRLCRTGGSTVCMSIGLEQTGPAQEHTESPVDATRPRDDTRRAPAMPPTLAAASCKAAAAPAAILTSFGRSIKPLVANVARGSGQGASTSGRRLGRQQAQVVCVAEAQRSMNRAYESKLKYKCVRTGCTRLFGCCHPKPPSATSSTASNDLLSQASLRTGLPCNLTPGVKFRQLERLRAAP